MHEIVVHYIPWEYDVSEEPQIDRFLRRGQDPTAMMPAIRVELRCFTLFIRCISRNWRSFARVDSRAGSISKSNSNNEDWLFHSG